MIFILVNGKEKLNSRKKNSVFFVEILNSFLCKVFLIVLVFVIVGILVVMIKMFKEIMDFGSNIIGFLKLIYRGMR